MTNNYVDTDFDLFKLHAFKDGNRLLKFGEVGGLFKSADLVLLHPVLLYFGMLTDKVDSLRTCPFEYHEDTPVARFQSDNLGVRNEAVPSQHGKCGTEVAE